MASRVVIYCPACQQKHVINAISLGTIRRCDNCGERFTASRPPVNCAAVLVVLALVPVTLAACCGGCFWLAGRVESGRAHDSGLAPATGHPY